ncbi:CvpA family protein [Ferruginibacter sp.]
MNFADIILIVTIVLFTWLGYKSGFINSFLGLLQWGGALTMAVLFYQPVTALLNRYFLIEEGWQRPLAFALVFLLGFLLLLFLFTSLKKLIPPEARYSYANKLTGIIPGFLTGIGIAVIMANILAASVWFATPEKENKSFLLSSIVNSSNWLDSKMSRVFNPPQPQKISGAHEIDYVFSDEFKSDNYQPVHELEQQMLSMVNAERTKRGLKPLVPDATLYLAAYNHAADMFSKGYFAHNTPEGIDPFQRMKKLGITYTSAGENLAHSYNLDSAHNGLMNSPGHRANILNGHFGKAGIAVLVSQSKGMMVVQEFSN